MTESNGTDLDGSRLLTSLEGSRGAAMFEYGIQTPLSPTSDLSSAHLFGQETQIDATDGLQFGSVSWQDNSLDVDTLWNMNPIKHLTYRSRTVHTARLSVIGADKTPQSLESIVENNTVRIKTSKIKIPDQVNFE